MLGDERCSTQFGVQEHHIFHIELVSWANKWKIWETTLGCREVDYGMSYNWTSDFNIVDKYVNADYIMKDFDNRMFMMIGNPL